MAWMVSRRQVDDMSKTIDIMMTDNMWWESTATESAPALSDHSELALAAKIFQARPECDVVAVMDGAGRVTRTIHRNHASRQSDGAESAQE